MAETLFKPAANSMQREHKGQGDEDVEQTAHRVVGFRELIKPHKHAFYLPVKFRFNTSACASFFKSENDRAQPLGLTL